MNLKKGQLLYSVWADDDGKCELETFVVRTIWKHKRIVFAILKNSSTWGKLSKKQGHYGWRNPIDEWNRVKIFLDNKELPVRLAITKLGAWRIAKKYYNDPKSFDWEEDGDGKEIYEKVIKTIGRMIGRLRSKK